MDTEEKSDAAGVAQVAANWRMDHRVELKREQAMLDSDLFTKSMDGAEFKKAKQTYYNDRLCKPANTTTPAGICPDCYADFNSNNKIPAGTFSPNNFLIHIASLTSLLWRALYGSGMSADLEMMIENSTGMLPPAESDLSNDTITPLVNILKKAGEKEIQQFAGAVSNALGPTEPHWWAAFSFEVDPFLSGDDWTKAASVLGLGHLVQGDWLIAWRYSVETPTVLYRPTVVETADNGFHFPSPPSKKYGITMPLFKDHPMVREIIHPPLKGDPSTAACLGRIGRIEKTLVDVESPEEIHSWFQKRRQSHRNHLLDPATETDQDWIMRHRHRV